MHEVGKLNRYMSNLPPRLPFCYVEGSKEKRQTCVSLSVACPGSSLVCPPTAKSRSRFTFECFLIVIYSQIYRDGTPGPRRIMKMTEAFV